MGEFPSGQRGQTVNLLRHASVVRIHLLPPRQGIPCGIPCFLFKPNGRRWIRRRASRKQSGGLFLARAQMSPFQSMWTHQAAQNLSQAVRNLLPPKQGIPNGIPCFFMFYFPSRNSSTDSFAKRWLFFLHWTRIWKKKKQTNCPLMILQYCLQAQAICVII